MSLKKKIITIDEQKLCDSFPKFPTEMINTAIPEFVHIDECDKLKLGRNF